MYFKFAHSSTQTKPNTKQDIYLKHVILALIITGSAKIAKIKCLQRIVQYQLILQLFSRKWAYFEKAVSPVKRIPYFSYFL